MKKRKEFTSALLLVGTSAVSAFVQNVNTVCAVGKVNTNFSWLGAFFYKTKNCLCSALFGLLSKSQKKNQSSVPDIVLPLPEDFVSNMYDKNVEKRAIKEFELERGLEEEKNEKAKEVPKFHEELKKIPDDEKDKYKIKATIQENYETLVGIRKKIALEKIEGAKKLLPSLKAEIMNLEKTIEGMKKSLEALNPDSKGKKEDFEKANEIQKNAKNQALNNKAVGSLNQPQVNLQVKDKKKVESEIKKYKETLKNKQENLKFLEEISKISEENFNKVPVSEREVETYEATLYKAFEISKVEGNDCSSGINRNLREGDYFKEVVGCSESYFRNHLEKVKQCLRKDKDGNIIIKNLLNGREFCAGKFEQISLGAAKEALNNKQASEEGKIRILGINKPFYEASKELIKKVDVSFLLGKNEDKCALHVVASNFNAVEICGHGDNVEKKFITEGGYSYFDDHTQGPAEALPALSGTIVRHYLINMEKYPDDPSKWGQASEGDRAVNPLEGLEIKTKNGHIYDSLDKIKEVSKKLQRGDEELKNKFKISYHANVQVSAASVDFDKKSVNFIYDKNKRVNQAYVAAVSLYQNDLKTILIEDIRQKENERIEKMSIADVKAEIRSKLKQKDYEKLTNCTEEEYREKLKQILLSHEAYEIRSIRTNEDEENYDKTHDNKFKNCREVLEEFARQIARLNYETIFKAAVAKGNKKVYIPLLGCGVFKNKYKWVIDAIKENKEFIKNNGLEVVLNIAGSGANTPNFYKDVTPLIMDDNGNINSKNFEVYEERNGAIVDVGEKILGFIQKDLETKSSKNANKIVDKNVSKSFFQRLFCYIFG